MYKDSIKFIKDKIERKPEIGIVLGSGLGNFVEQLENKIELPYHEIPGFAASTVVGHKGQLVFGTINDINVVAMQGRMHYYEGHDIKDVVFPIRILALLGIEILLITNAAGGVNTDFSPGDIMIIKDHINFAGINPLRGPNNEDFGPRFPDMSYTYDRDLMEIAEETADELDFSLQKGCYMWFSGPTYETPAEVNMARILGADAVGMSTVPEAIVARHMGLKLLGLSCITNMAAGILDEPLNHSDVIKVSAQINEKFKELVTEIIRKAGAK